MEYRIASADDIGLLMESRLETLKAVNHLNADAPFSEDFVNASRQYFLRGDQTTVLAVDHGQVAGCASLCYLRMMPTVSHPSGRRAHLMNVYTHPAWRRKGVARQMVTMLIAEARARGVTEISLDATAAGRPLYENLGFKGSDECMTLCL